MVMEITSVLVKWIGSEAKAKSILYRIGLKGFSDSQFA